MKVAIRIFLVAFALIFMLSGCLGSGRIPNGTYTRTDATSDIINFDSFIIKGNRFKVPVSFMGTELYSDEYTYRIRGNEMILTRDMPLDKYFPGIVKQTLSYEKNGNTYVIDGVEFIKDSSFSGLGKLFGF